MNEVSAVADFENLGLTRLQEQARSDLGQEDFLRLMVTQLENQDPFEPMESGDFLGQIAQFGTVEGLATLNGSFESLANSLVSNQALQAASLVGRSVLVDSSEGFLEDGGTLGGAAELVRPATNVTIQITDSAGVLVREIDLGAQNAGLVSFQWGGETSSGAPAPPGRYRMTAQVVEQGRQSDGVNVFVNAQVDSVSFGPRGLNINLRGLGEIPFGAVKQIG
jgi:flagellar basal-body rod modification protein FlgD